MYKHIHKLYNNVRREGHFQSCTNCRGGKKGKKTKIKSCGWGDRKRHLKKEQL